MPFIVDKDEVARLFPEYEVKEALTPSEQKAAFLVEKDSKSLCLKIIAPNTEVDRLNREIDALIRIDHHNVVQFVEYSFSITNQGRRHYIIEEFVPGEDLENRLGEKWDHDEALDFFASLLDGLAELEKENLVHRDLKPTNVRVHENGFPVIIDFGLARHLDKIDLTKTEEGAAIGTPLYFAPEQFEGTKHDIDYRTDLFTCGVLMYYAFTGRHPFRSDSINTYVELKQRVCETDFHLNHDDFTSLPSAIQLIISKMLSKRRENRPSGANQVATLLRKIAS
jgi:serine/threonine-protein kinase